MGEFRKCHPMVNFLYFTFVIAFAMFFMHPLCLAISLTTSLIYSVMLSGGKTVKFSLICLLPLLIVSALINPLFNHQGVTILAYFPSGNPLTFESVIYGLAAATMIVSVICIFSCFNVIMTSDKLMQIFGRIIPSLSLIFSMVLRFVPRFKNQIKEVISGQKCLGFDLSKGSMIQRIRTAGRILSIMITWSLESAIDTADSMKSRGYGLPGRTAFSVFKFDKRDKKILIYILFMAAYVLTGEICGVLSFNYFPSIEPGTLGIYATTVFVAYFLLCATPIILECLEAKKWNSLKQKI